MFQKYKGVYSHSKREHEISQGMERIWAELKLFLPRAVHLAHRTQDRNEQRIVFRNSAWKNEPYPSHSRQTSHKHAQKMPVFHFSPDHSGERIRETAETRRLPDVLSACKSHQK